MSSIGRFIASIFSTGALALGCMASEGSDDAFDAPEMTHEVAQAASYNGVCGSGYGVIDSHSLTGGTVYLTYNSTTGKNCVVTIRNTPGTQIYMDARVSRAGQAWIDDPGQFTTYAGPVYVTASHACIDWGGTIGSSIFNEFGTHCG